MRRIRTGIKHRVEIRKVVESMYRTCCTPTKAMTPPATAGPNNIPMLLVV